MLDHCLHYELPPAFDSKESKIPTSPLPSFLPIFLFFGGGCEPVTSATGGRGCERFLLSAVVALEALWDAFSAEM